MKVFLCSLTRRFAVLFVLLLAEVPALHLLAQPKGTPGEVVVLQQDMFAPRSKHAQPTFERVNVKSLDGKPISFDQLPAKAKEKLNRLEMRVSPRVEMKDADPREAIRMIISKPTPRHMIRLGLISERQEQDIDPSWLADLSFEEKRLSCVVTNVSFLDLSVVLADTFDCEFGVTADGQAMFRNKNAAARAKHRLHVVKSKSSKLE